MQEKKRYILVAFNYDGRIGKEDASRLVSQAVIEGTGELGASKAKAFVKEYDENKKTGIVKCQTKMLEEVMACLALKTVWNGKPIAMRALKVSGAISKVWVPDHASSNAKPLGKKTLQG